MPTLIGWKSMLCKSIKHATLVHFKSNVCFIKSGIAMCWEFNRFFIKKEINKPLSTVNCTTEAAEALNKW